MKIGIVIESLQIGGMETVLKSLAQFFRKDGNDVEFIEVFRTGPWSDYFASLGFRVKTVPAKQMVSRYAHASRIAQVLSGYDVLLLNDVPLAQASLGMLGSDTVTIPIIHLDMPSFILNAAGNFGQWNKVVAVSPMLKEKFVRDTGIGAEHIEFVANAVDLSDKEAGWRANGKKIQLLFIGRVENSQKGVFLLPEIMRQISLTASDVHLNVVGDGPDLRQLKQMFKDSGINNVSFFGALLHDEALEVMRSSRIMLMPSYFEGMPIALLEAMSNGLVPVVSNLRNSTDFIVEDGVNGYLADPGDIEGFALKIAACLESVDRLNAISGEAMNTVKRKFTTEIMGGHYRDIIREAIEANSRKPLKRTKKIDQDLLGDFSRMPVVLTRPLRKIKRILSL
ncbi:MAG TPA: glycosyltransferase family 4 protein [Chlorobaculum sp.]|nr:glycosyltransferase family 4 protein [Chlorobaculum sp.]